MPSISTCPRCQKSVSIPTGIADDAVVRCPMCNAEYPLGEAIPPELIPVLVPVSEPSTPGAESADTTEAAETGDDGVITIALEPGDELVEPAEAEDEITIEPTASEELPSEEVPGEEEPGEMMFGEEAEEDTYSLAGDHPVEEEAEAVEEENAAIAAIGGVGKAPVRRRRQKSALATLIEVVTGGLAGCLVAYYGLAFFLGPDLKAKGFPIFTFLPGIERLTTPAEKEKPPVEKDKNAADASAKAKPANGEATKAAEPPKDEPKAPANPPADVETAPAAAAPAVEAKPAKAEVKWLRPKLGTAEYVGPRTPKSTTADDLAKVMDEATAKAGDPTSPDAYEALCRVGATMAFVNGEASDTQLTDRIATARAAIEAIAKQAEVYEKLAEAAKERIDAPAGQHVGVLLAGTVKNVVKQKQIYGAIVELAGQSKTVSVLSDMDSELKADDQVVVLGIVVREPGANLVGYSGSKPSVVWAAVAVKKP